MDFTELAKAFAERHAIADLSVEDGVTALEIDGMAISLAESGDGVVASAGIGTPPSEKPETFAHLLLEANMEAVVAGGHVFARNPESGAYILTCRLVERCGDLDAFDAALASFVSKLELWRRLLADFRPAAHEAATASAAAEGETMNALRSGFLRV